MPRTHFALLTIGLAVPAFVLSRAIWPDPPGVPPPPSELVPFLLVPALFEAVAFGAGVAFLLAAGRALISGRRSDGLTIAACASAGWALVSWWPHSNMHRANTTLEGLIRIDWVFHLSLIVGAAIIGVYLYRVLSRAEQRQRLEPTPVGRLADPQAKGMRS
jgi:hypothetical protein